MAALHEPSSSASGWCFRHINGSRPRLRLQAKSRCSTNQWQSIPNRIKSYINTFADCTAGNECEWNVGALEGRILGEKTRLCHPKEAFERITQTKRLCLLRERGAAKGGELILKLIDAARSCRRRNKVLFRRDYERLKLFNFPNELLGEMKMKSTFRSTNQSVRFCEHIFSIFMKGSNNSARWNRVTVSKFLFLRDQAVRWDKNKTRSMMCEILRCEVNSTRMINAREGETKKSRSESPLKIIELKVVQVRMCCKWRGRRHQGWECSERKICHRASGISFAWIARRFPMNFPSA